VGSRRGAIPGRCDGLCGGAWIAGIVVAVAGFGGGALNGAPPAVAAELDLDQPVQAVWTGVPLRTWADRVAKIAGRPVVIDRRLDPDLAITLAAGGESLATVLEKVAQAAGARVVPLRSSIRIAPVRSPAAACDRAELAREQAIGKLPQAARQAVARRSSWKWPAGARPRDLVAAAVDEARVKVLVEGIERVPHDHFPAASLPALSLGERLDLVLAHFDLRIDWRSGATGPVAAIVAIDDSLPAMPPPALPRAGVEPPKPSEKKPLRQDQGRPVKTKQTFTLTAAAPLEELLAAVAGRLGVRLDIDREALDARGIALREIVRVEVQDASAAELLEAVLSPLKLRGEVVGGRLEIRGAVGP